MSPTVKTHPLADIIAKRLFGIETVPVKEQRKMVNRAVKSACEYHDSKITDKEGLVEMIRLSYLAAVNDAEDGHVSWCNQGSMERAEDLYNEFVTNGDIKQ